MREPQEGDIIVIPELTDDERKVKSFNLRSTHCIFCGKNKHQWSGGHIHIPFVGIVTASFHDKCRPIPRKFTPIKECGYKGKGCYGKRSIFWLFRTNFKAVIWHMTKYRMRNLYWDIRNKLIS